jgi:hypothetical protein
MVKIEYKEYAFDWQIDSDFEDLSDIELVTQFRCEFPLSSEELQHKYSLAHLEQHPLFPREIWVREVEEDNVSAGYWNWVVSQIQQTFCDIIPRTLVGDESLYKDQARLPGM